MRAIADELPGSPEEMFWSWFAAHASRIREFEARGDWKVFTAIEARLAAVEPGLAFELSPPDDGPAQILFTAGGDPALFPAVERLVRAAPELPGWRVIAFRQPRPGVIVYDGLLVDPSTIWFGARSRGGHLAVTVYVPEPWPAGLAGGAILTLLHYTIGELATERRLARVEAALAPADPRACGLRPIAELPQAIEALVTEATA